ncbi:MAG: M20/M25/M40 family metallo-hydrolase, partial [Thermomicrobiales bacterium]
MSDALPRPVVLLQHLIEIPSVNPAYDAKSSGELLVARFIERWADGLGLCVEKQIVLDGRYNLICRLVIDENLPTLLFESHMDTVGIVPGTRADFMPKIEGGLLYGRGACDTKGSMAAMIAAVERLVSQRNQLACNIQFLAAVDEETIGSGSLLYARSSPNVVAAIVGEPTGNRIVNAHKGVFRDRITVVGKAAHTSVASEGINAIDGMADVIVALREVSHRLTG